MQPLISVKDVTLSVPLFVQRERQDASWATLLMGAIFDPPKREYRNILEQVSFEAYEGDRVALLGRNGAGKSTLLRLLNGVYAPSVGQMDMRGSCQALLDIGLGFVDEATLRENIYLRGTAMGLAPAELRRSLDDILEFAGLTEKANHRLRTLSSGQRMRLGFAICTAKQQDIMLMDEWLGTGDAQFLDRAIARLEDRVGGSKVIVLASHGMGLLREICNRGVVLDKGRMMFCGPIREAVDFYQDMLERLRASGEVEMEADEVPASFGYVERLDVHGDELRLFGWLAGPNGALPDTLEFVVGQSVIQMPVTTRYPRPDVRRNLALHTDDLGFEARVECPGFLDRVSQGDKVIVRAGYQGLITGMIEIAPEVYSWLGEHRG